MTFSSLISFLNFYPNHMDLGQPAIIELCPNQPGDVERTCADISSAKDLLGYNPVVTFEEGIAKTVEW